MTNVILLSNKSYIEMDAYNVGEELFYYISEYNLKHKFSITDDDKEKVLVLSDKEISKDVLKKAKTLLKSDEYDVEFFENIFKDNNCNLLLSYLY